MTRYFPLSIAREVLLPAMCFFFFLSPTPSAEESPL